MVRNEELDIEESYLQLRSKFLQELDTSSNLYEPEDIERIKNDDNYVRRFILHKKGNFNNAYDMLKEALAWRKSFGVKYCTEDSIPPDFFNARAAFPYNHDLKGNPIILLLIRFHKKNAEYAKDMRRFVIYWVEKMEEESNGGQMTVIMNCVGAGLSNLDLDLIKFLITLFRSYYPHSLAHILIYEMPWIFNAAWKIIKTWLPEDFVEKIVFVNQTSILDFIGKDALPVEMNGTCTRQYEPPDSKSDVNSNTIIGNSRESEQKRVHFSQNGHISSESDEGISVRRPTKRKPKDGTSHLLMTDDYCILADMLKISPPQDLIFYPPSSKDETSEVIIRLTCVSDKAITYKVKTNNIDSYRVKPSVGIIEPENTIEISVFLVQGCLPQTSDKFLIMVMELPHLASSQSLSQLWRTSSPDVIADHKLRCVVGVTETQKRQSKLDSTLENINSSLSILQSKIQNLEARQKSTARMQVFTIFLLGMFAFSFWLYLFYIHSNGIPDFSFSSK